MAICGRIKRPLSGDTGSEIDGVLLSPMAPAFAKAAYVINGNCKNNMNMSQSDQMELWHSVLNGNLEFFLKVTSKLKLSVVEDEYTAKLYPSLKFYPSAGNTDGSTVVKTSDIHS